jgi:transposase
MKEALSIETERMDDLPLLLTHMKRMRVAELLDQHIPTHGQRKGLSVGELSVVWLAHILSQADHRMNRVQEWASRRLSTLRGCGMNTLSVQDMTDDRLADVLRLLSESGSWYAFEQELMGHLVRVYDMSGTCVRIDTTTVSSYAEVDEQGLLQLGHSKDHRPDLPQLKLVLASLDPLGMPLATEVLSGEHADDPLYVPIIARVRDGLQRRGLLYVGDCKMAALQTRASLAAQGDFYLCPLSSVQVSAEQISQHLATLRAQGSPPREVSGVDKQGKPTCIAFGYEIHQTMSTQVDGSTLCWQERRLLVQSMAATRAAQEGLQERLQKAEQELASLTTPRQGKPRLKTHPQLDEAIHAILKRFRVEGLLSLQVQEQIQERSVRAYRGRLPQVRHECTFTLICLREEAAIVKAMDELGWRVYATNHLSTHLSLQQVVETYRDEYLVERDFARLKGHPLSLAPI